MFDSPPEISSARHGPSWSRPGSVRRSQRSAAPAGSPGRSSVTGATVPCRTGRPAGGALGDRHAVDLGGAVVDAEGTDVGVDPPDDEFLGGPQPTAQLDR